MDSSSGTNSPYALTWSRLVQVPSRMRNVPTSAGSGLVQVPSRMSPASAFSADAPSLLRCGTHTSPLPADTVLGGGWAYAISGAWLERARSPTLRTRTLVLDQDGGVLGVAASRRSGGRQDDAGDSRVAKCHVGLIPLRRSRVPGRPDPSPMCARSEGAV
jgi:hypothetical protein